jgi:hypothetical protein
VLSDPDSPFYPLKQTGESVLLATSLDPVARADLEIKLAQTRTREAETMAASSRPDLAVRAVRARYDTLRHAAADLVHASRRDAGWKSVRDRWEETASEPVTSVERQLAAGGFKEQATEVRNESSTFQDDRKRLDPALGKPAASPQPVPSATP